jgi:hypothetical protein
MIQSKFNNHKKKEVTKEEFAEIENLSSNLIDTANEFKSHLIEQNYPPSQGSKIMLSALAPFISSIINHLSDDTEEGLRSSLENLNIIYKISRELLEARYVQLYQSKEQS